MHLSSSILCIPLYWGAVVALPRGNELIGRQQGIISPPPSSDSAILSSTQLFTQPSTPSSTSAVSSGFQTVTTSEPIPFSTQFTQSSELPSMSAVSSGFQTATTPDPILSSTQFTRSSELSSTSAVSSGFQTATTSKSIPSTASSTSEVLIPIVLPATNTPTQTITNTQVQIPSPTISGTPGSLVQVQNPENPDQSVTFGKTKLPESQRDELPDISDAAPLALLLLFGGFETLVTIDSAFNVVFPLFSAAWLTAALFPAAASIGDGDTPDDNVTTEGPTSITSTSSCAVATVTDFYVSCDATSGATTQTCSTYSSVITSGCTSSVTAVTTTTFGAACPAFHDLTLVWPPIRVSSTVASSDESSTLPSLSTTSVVEAPSISASSDTALSTSEVATSNPPTSTTSASPNTALSTSEAATSNPPTSVTSASTSITQYSSILNIGVTVPTSSPDCNSNSRTWELSQSVEVTPDDMVNSVNLYWNVKDASNQAGQWTATIQYTDASMQGSIYSWQAGSGNMVSRGMAVDPSIQFSGGDDQAATFLRLFLSISQPITFTVTISGTFECTPDPPPVPENPSGTDVIINAGCVLVNDSPRCNAAVGHIADVYSGSYHVNADQGETSTAVILAGFDESQWSVPMLAPGCQLNAHWPRDYQQVYFGEDKCLYDGNGNNIDGQCCSTPDADHSGEVINPWLDPRPAASCQRTPFGVGVHFTLYIKGWVDDGGAELWKQVGGCGALTGKRFGTTNSVEVDGSDQNIGYYEAEYLMEFNLPLTFKKGCVGRAIVSAGGPQGGFC